ncbi:hypothetical protein [Paraburkholderia sp. J67]|uniref:hypothetical protein n=1 Tax=Paraburkholderia sp. J67 TaxID=2805435 RepID=UPI002ABD4DF2|nr:hypothetical protein [Paraburkholderia sp. J67]
MRIEAISRTHVLDRLEKEFGFTNVVDTTKIAALSEHVRAAISFGSHPDNSFASEPVATATITRTVVQRLSPIWPDLRESYELPRSPVVNVIEKLAKLGEFTKTDSYHWLPAPSRVVEIDADTALLISPSPLLSLPLRYRRAVQVVGSCRLVQTKLTTPGKSLPVQGLVEWLGLPNDDVHIWLKEFLERNTSAMMPVQDLQEPEIFGEGRWTPCHEITNVDGIQLCRRKVLGIAMREYGLCRLKKSNAGGSEIASLIGISRQDARRIQGALSTKHDRSRRVRYRREGNTVTLFAPRPFPEPENVFLELGWRSAEQSAADWPRRYTFSASLLPLIERAVGLLGHELVEQTDGV